MIIKSMARKDPSYAQLARYIEAGAAVGNPRLYQSLGTTNARAVAVAFEKNGQRLRTRSNGVCVYHEIISITRARSLPVEEQKQLLLGIARAYLTRRAPKCLAFGALHSDKASNLHFHLMISANIEDGTRHRLSRAEFVAIQRDLERRVLEQYPELEQSVAINKRSARKQSSRAEGLERRTGQLPEKQSVAQRLRGVLAHAGSEEEFHGLLSEARLTIYVRGKNIGVVDDETGRKHRLTTLDLIEPFKAMTARIEVARTARNTVTIEPEVVVDISITPTVHFPAEPVIAPTITQHEDDMIRKPTNQQAPIQPATQTRNVKPEVIASDSAKASRSLKSVLGFARDLAYGAVKGLGDGFHDVVSGPSDPAIKRRSEIAEQRKREMDRIRQGNHSPGDQTGRDRSQDRKR
jgi:hypothetical protein